MQQIKIRAERIGNFGDSLKLLCETNLDTIKAVIDREKPQIVVIDSIQTMFNEEVSSAPGSVSQVRESTGVLMQIAKGMGISIFIVGHVTKEGVVDKKSAGTLAKQKATASEAKVLPLSQIEMTYDKRVSTDMKELDRVLGGGIVQGSMVLVGGDPGIGKSTLLLQVCRNLSEHNIKVLYISVRMLFPQYNFSRCHAHEV